jgi:hypothetical protein
MNAQPTVIPNAEDYLQSSACFSGVKRTVISKDFKGGRISNVFGSTELDLSSADINGTAILDLSLAFGEIVITVPCDWRIDADLSQFMATVEDNRDNVYQTNSMNKVLMLRGSSTCGLVEIQHNC